MAVCLMWALHVGERGGKLESSLNRIPEDEAEKEKKLLEEEKELKKRQELELIGDE